MGGRDSYYTSRAAVIIDNSGSTMQQTGIIHKESGHAVTELDRHIMTATVYLTNFPKKGSYRIISCMPGGEEHNYYGDQDRFRDFDNTDDAIEYLFTLRPGGGGFMRHDFKSKIDELTKAYNNVLLLMDEPIGGILG